MIDKLYLAGKMKQFVDKDPNFYIRDYAGVTSEYRKDYNLYKKDADFNRKFTVYNFLNLLQPLDDGLIKELFEGEGIIIYRFLVYGVETTFELRLMSKGYFPIEYQARMRKVIVKLIEIGKLIERGGSVGEATL